MHYFWKESQKASNLKTEVRKKLDRRKCNIRADSKRIGFYRISVSRPKGLAMREISSNTFISKFCRLMKRQWTGLCSSEMVQVCRSAHLPSISLPTIEFVKWPGNFTWFLTALTKCLESLLVTNYWNDNAESNVVLLKTEKFNKINR